MEALSILILFLIGIYFSFKLKFQNLNLIKMIKNIISKNNTNNFSSLCISLSSKIGVGSISGVAFAIYKGGIGSIFWMWVTTLLTSSNTMAETILSLKYKEKDSSGPFYYMKKGLKCNYLAVIYAIIFLFSYLFGFLSIQVNTISTIINNSFNINTLFIGLFLCIVVTIFVFSNIKNLINTLTSFMPLITAIYIFFCLLIIIKNINLVDDIFFLIIKSAFNKDSFITGFLVGSIKSLFSTESGLGTSAIATGIVNTTNYIDSALVQTFGNIFDTFIITTLTAFIVIMCPNNYDLLTDINGIELVSNAFIFHLDSIGGFVINISIILFAFATIIGSFYYINIAFKYLFKKDYFIYKLVFLLIVFTSVILSPTLIWNLIDKLIALLAIINSFTLFLLRKDVK